MGVWVAKDAWKSSFFADFHKEYKQIEVMDVLWVALAKLALEQFGLYLAIL